MEVRWSLELVVGAACRNRTLRLGLIRDLPLHYPNGLMEVIEGAILVAPEGCPSFRKRPGERLILLLLVLLLLVSGLPGQPPSLAVFLVEERITKERANGRPGWASETGRQTGSKKERQKERKKGIKEITNERINKRQTERKTERSKERGDRTNERKTERKKERPNTEYERNNELKNGKKNGTGDRITERKK